MAKLKNPKHEAFCNEYLIDLNLKQAYMRTYPDAKAESAQANASRLITNDKVQERIKELMDKRAKRVELTQERVIQRIANIAFGNIGMVCVMTEDGLDIKDFDDLSEEELSIIQELNITPVSDGDGGKLGYNKRVKLKDSLKALEMLSKHLGILDGQGADRKNTGAIQGRLLEAVKRLGGKK